MFIRHRVFANSRHFSTCLAVRSRATATATATEGRSFAPRLDYRKLTQDDMAQNIANRNLSLDAALVHSLYKEKVALAFDVEALRKRRNEVAADMKRLAKGKRDPDAVEALKNEGRMLKEKLSDKEKLLAALEAKLYDEAKHLPNDTCPSAPIGPEENAEVVSIVNKHLLPESHTSESSKSIRNHVNLCELHDMADFSRASKVAGSGFYFLKNFGALLEQALQRYAIDTLILNHGFTPVSTPDVIRHEVLEACGFSPRANVQDPQTYFLSTHLDHTSANQEFDPMRLCLAATAEFPLAAMHAGEVLKPQDLPIKYVGLGRAFRAEGLSGSINRGLYRVHQFSKVEMFGIVAGGCGEEGAKEALKRSEAMMEEFKGIEYSLFEGLELCFRILNMPTEELGAPAYKKYDMEAWMPGKNAWGEISSTSNCTDYQSRRLSIRNHPATASPGTAAQQLDFVHTINGTAAAIPRLIIALLETHQRPNGDVYIPKALRPFLLNGKVEVVKAGESFRDVMARLR
ncbi:seryl-tRNA synthetase [Podochytrium sp. JEL0797]|nr:seryl-tRNA synthetase [Podochytrium sp. JEL0797]